MLYISSSVHPTECHGPLDMLVCLSAGTMCTLVQQCHPPADLRICEFPQHVGSVIYCFHLSFITIKVYFIFSESYLVKTFTFIFFFLPEAPSEGVAAPVATQNGLLVVINIHHRCCAQTARKQTYTIFAVIPALISVCLYSKIAP